tara:strand:+ start:211 stop:1050 length:840 start_codon:yes stop_codon:yes gene_type:complete
MRYFLLMSVIDSRSKLRGIKPLFLMKDFLKSLWKNQPNLTIGIGSAIILLGGFSIISLNPELGVSDEGIEECLDQSNRKRNRFTAQKTYKRCLKKIDEKIAQEKKASLEAERKRDEEIKRKKDERIAKRNAALNKFREVVDKRKEEFIAAGWESVSRGKNYYGLARDIKRIGMSHAVARIYFLKRYEEPYLTPENYFKKYAKGKLAAWDFDNDEWFVVECDTKRYAKSKAFYNKDFLNSETNPERAAKAIRAISEYSWEEPYEKGLMGYAFSKRVCTEK